MICFSYIEKPVRLSLVY